MEDDFDDFENFAEMDELDELDGPDESDDGEKISDYDVESAGFMDGESDANLGMPKFGGYGSSLDLYDNAYDRGNDAVSDFEEDSLDEY